MSKTECDFCKEEEEDISLGNIKNKWGQYCDSCLSEYDYYVNSKISERKEERADRDDD